MQVAFNSRVWLQCVLHKTTCSRFMNNSTALFITPAQWRFMSKLYFFIFLRITAQMLIQCKRESVHGVNPSSGFSIARNQLAWVSIICLRQKFSYSKPLNYCSVVYWRLPLEPILLANADLIISLAAFLKTLDGDLWPDKLVGRQFLRRIMDV